MSPGVCISAGAQPPSSKHRSRRAAVRRRKVLFCTVFTRFLFGWLHHITEKKALQQQGPVKNLCRRGCTHLRRDILCLPVDAHLFVVILILSGDNGLPTIFVIHIPLDGLLNDVCQFGFRQPAKRAMDLGGVNGITHIVSHR